MNAYIYLLKKTYKISKNDNKIHENLQVTYKILKNIQIPTYKYKQNFINLNPSLQIF